MINIDIYNKIIDTSSITNHIINISIICVLSNLAIFFLYGLNHDDKKINLKTNENNFNYLIFFSGIIQCFLLIAAIPFLVKIGELISVIYIPSIILIIYALYIKPIKSLKKEEFKIEYYSYGAIIMLIPYILTNIDYKRLLYNVTSEGTIQIICIIILLLEIYTSFYCLLLNIYFIIKNLKKIKCDEIFKNAKKLRRLLFKIIESDKFFLNFYITNKLLKSKKSIIKKIVLFIPLYTFEVLLCITVTFFQFVLLMIIRPISIIIDMLILYFKKISNSNENQMIYRLTKIVWVFSFIIVYIILQENVIFQERIINTYEFISSVIIIPIILDALNTFANIYNSN